MPLSSTIPDLVRVALVGVFLWAGWRDYQTRRLPDRLWPPLLLIGGGLLIWELIGHWPLTTGADLLFVVRVSLSIGIIIPLAYLSYRLGAMGGADKKALVTLAILFPTYPTYLVPLVGTVPVVETTIGIFSLTIFTNAMILAASYPLALGLKNSLNRTFSWVIFFARPVTTASLNSRHGRLMGCHDADGNTRSGADLDAVRMYLRWRGLSFDEIQTDQHTSLRTAPVTETYPPTDGAVHRAAPQSDSPTQDEHHTAVDGGQPSPADADPWAAEQFLTDIDSTAYNTSAESLRASLHTIATADRVWVMPGIPLVVPICLGLVVAILYGDLLYAILSLTGVV